MKARTAKVPRCWRARRLDLAAVRNGSSLPGIMARALTQLPPIMARRGPLYAGDLQPKEILAW